MTNLLTLDISERFEFADGDEFGAVGAYERLKGRARFAVDPTAPAQAGVTDIALAPVEGDGLVRFEADFSILQPVDPGRGNRRLFFDYGNRGNIRCLQFFNDAPGSNDPRRLEDAGNGFLMRRGYTVAWLGWQADLLPGDERFLLSVPVARRDGERITGPVRVEYIVETAGTTTMPLSGRASTRSHPAVSLEPSEARFSRRRYAESRREPIAADRWCFARVESGMGLDAQGAEFSLVPSAEHIHLPESFEPGWIYELVYEGGDPLILGLGHVGVRDFVSHLRYGDDSRIDKAYAWGRSQTGRCIRDFVYLGFNGDAAGRRVFDGVMPHVSGAGRMWMNHRFANVIVAAGQQYEDHYNPADSFPFSYAASRDHLTGKTDAILKRPETDPLVMHTQTATEYWQRRGSLVHTDSEGNDLEQPANVRIYLWASSQHFANPRVSKVDQAACQNEINIVRTSMLFRAALDALDAWASDGTAPPESRIPRRADGSLVDMDDWRRQFPVIPGRAIPKQANALAQLDFGAEAEAGILQEPPRVIAETAYAALVPAVDADGNETAGVRAPMVAAPLATYTGWNLRRPGQGHGATHEFTGSTIPFPGTEEERAYTGDPRPSVAARYGSVDDYVSEIRAAAETLVRARLMLEEDLALCVRLAKAWNRPGLLP